MDPLQLLREYNINKKLANVVTSTDKVMFGDSYEFPLQSFTAFKKTGGDYYTLDVLLYLLRHRELPQPDYLRAASSAIPKVAAVSLADRKKLLDYLDGLMEVDLGAAPGGTLPSFGSAAPQLVGTADAAGQPMAKRAKLDESDEAIALRQLQSQERQLRDRNSMLLAPNKSFERVLQILKKAVQPAPPSRHTSSQAKPVVSSHRPQQKQPLPPPPPPPPPVATALPILPSGRFERDSRIDQLGAMAPGVGAAAVGLFGYGVVEHTVAASISLPQQPAVPGGLTSSQPVTSSSQPPSASSRHGGGGKPAAGAGSGAGSGRQAPAVAGGKMAPAGKDAKKGVGIPIIIVPSGITAMLNMYNAPMFLEDGRYETPTAALARLGPTKPPFAIVNRKLGRPTPVVYHVMEKVPAKHSPDWERVVAVVAAGNKWQLKEFPFKGAAEGEFVELFSRIAGFFLHYADEKVPPLVANWNVKKLALHRENRHKDGAVLLDLYRHLDAFLGSKKSPLQY